MKYINSSDNLDGIDKKSINEIPFNKLGRPINESDEKVFAKSISIHDGKTLQNKYAILVFNNQPYDPYGVDSHRESKLQLNLKSVMLETFNYYLSYLKTKNSLYLTRCQRSFING